MSLGESLCEPDTRIRHVYFPTSSIVSLQYVLENGSSSEMAVVGSEGILGVPIYLDAETTLGRAVVQCSGHGYRMSASILREEFKLGGTFSRVLLRYT